MTFVCLVVPTPYMVNPLHFVTLYPYSKEHMAASTECSSFSDTQLVSLLAEDATYLRCVSSRTREYCLRFMQKQSHGMEEDQLRDIYHDALIILYEKARIGQFQLTCSLQTYLNSICRNQLLNKFKEQGRTIPFPQAANADDGDEYEQYLPEIKDRLPSDDADINNERVQAIMRGLEIMKGKGDCYELLLMVHYRNSSMRQVMEHFGYKNEQIAKNKNYLCREKLKALTIQAMRRMR